VLVRLAMVRFKKLELKADGLMLTATLN